MPFFCSDADLLAWEPSVFLETVFVHQSLLREATVTLAGTALTVSGASLVAAGVLPGMVAQLTTADGSFTQLAEIVSLESPTAATVSALRARHSEPAIPPLTQGTLKLTIISFRPQIVATGAALLAHVGITSEGDTTSPAYADLAGFAPTCAFATLAALFRTLTENKHATNLTFTKHDFYAGLAQAARQTLAATIDQDGDGVPETRITAGSRAPVRE